MINPSVSPSSGQKIVKVSWDSMIDGGIHPDNILIVDRSLEPAVPTQGHGDKKTGVQQVRLNILVVYSGPDCENRGV